MCVSVCPAGYFGYNTTKACETQCPTHMYGNTTTRRCENCPGFCASCLNSTYCDSCVALA